ncbi:hypothetical protein SynBIOSU31_00045 [Synechococcus sp. BIOS-U3-1]|nr:hypothetical protein SynBIOSU31_00045 [Synechococcus sp. BIOS-U3-1]
MTALLKSAVPLQSVEPDREQLLIRAREWFNQARAQASEGNTAESAQLILKALNQERRAGSVGPQVVQLIKPRASTSNWGNRS